MKKCPICEEVFHGFDDIIIVENTYYHEKCLDVIAVRFCAYNPNDDDEDSFLGQFDLDDKTWASYIMEDGEYLEEKHFRVAYINVLTEMSEVEHMDVFAVDEKEAKEKLASQYRQILSAELIS